MDHRRTRIDAKDVPQIVDALTTRRCGGCDLCCTACAVLDMTPPKPMGERCTHMVQGACGSCGIYENRPPTCFEFYCTWRLSELIMPRRGGSGIPDRLFPAKCGFVLHWPNPFDVIMTLFKDPARPNRWTKYVRELKRIARDNDIAIAIGGADEATHVIAPSGRIFSRADFPELFRGVEVGVPEQEFKRRMTPTDTVIC